MTKNERLPLIAIALFVLAAFLIGFGGINAVRAAPRVESADYRAQVVLTNIHVVLVEQVSEKDEGTIVEGDDTLLTKLLATSGDSEFKVGKKYFERLCARNVEHPSQNKTGDGIDEYVRVSVYRYWTDENGKAVNLDPNLIELNFVTGKDWFIDKAASTRERTVLYYKKVLKVGEQTSPFVDGITINSSVATKMSGGSFDYSGVKFNIKATVDAVQTHNANEAMTSAWGRTNVEDPDNSTQTANNEAAADSQQLTDMEIKTETKPM